MTIDNADRTDDARRHDDSDLIDAVEPAPDEGGRSGGTLQRDIATRAEEARVIDGKTGVIRVRKDDEMD